MKKKTPRVSIRIDEDLAKEVKNIANHDNCSMQQTLLLLISKGISVCQEKKAKSQCTWDK